ncbi:MAG TPA: indole-3-glycerol phosphate synthase TrpC [Gemmatimonadales bacterium]|jgi:indole-3-glycerol phosphate synthase
MTTLDRILDQTRSTLPGLRASRRQLELAAGAQPAGRDFAGALRGSAVALIAEVKRQSPSAGVINRGLDPVSLATAYADGGAAAVSVLTDTAFFGGSLDDLDAVAREIPLAVLRKDFILDETQLLEARAAGAAAALLIVRALDQLTLRRLIEFTHQLGLTPLVEAHDADELEGALEAGATVVGINARNLDTFAIDTASAWELIAAVPSSLLAVAESGMATRSDVAGAAKAGADAVLIGSALARASDPARMTRELTGVVRHAR